MKNKSGFILAAVMCVFFMAALSINALAATSGECGENLTWTLDGGTLTVSGTGEMTKYSSQTSVPWYSSRKLITDIVIEEGVTTIGNNAFSYCTALVNVSLPDTLTDIGNRAFSSCESLELVKIPKSVQSIESYAFSYCDSLCEIVMPDEMTSIGTNAFYSCNKLSEIVIPNGVTKLDSYVFWGCPIKKITIPPSVTSIDSTAGYGWSTCVIRGYKYSFAEIFAENNSAVFEAIGEIEYSVIEEGNVSDTVSWQYDSYCTLKITGEGEIPDYDKNSDTPWSSYGEGIVNLEIGEGITRIGENSFNTFSNLKTISLPKTLKSIGAFSFKGDSRVSEIVIPEGVLSIETDAFADCDRLKYITIPASVEEMSGEIFYGCSPTVKGYSYSIADSYCDANNIAFESIGEVEYRVLFEGDINSSLSWKIDNRWYITVSGNGDIPDYDDLTPPWADHLSLIRHVKLEDGITSVGHNAFSGCDTLREVVMANSVTNIGNGAFENCTRLKDFTMSENVSAIGIGAFFSCTSLENITLPGSLTKISSRAFYNCALLKAIEIPESVEAIEKSAFENCSLLSSVVIPQKVTEISDGVFANCRALATVEIKGDITRIGEKAFYYTHITSLELPPTVTKIGNGAFGYCSSLETLTMGEGVEKIGDEAFLACSSLKEITLPKTLREIGKSAFSSCKALSEVDIPEGVEEIPERAFYGCTALANVTVPDSVTKIGDYAFSRTGIKDNFTIKGSVKTIGTRAFSETDIKSLVLEEGVETISVGAFRQSEMLTSISLPESLTEIGDSAFEACKLLTEITIPKGVKRLGEGAFSNCAGLKSVTVSANGIDLCDSAFYNCKAMTSFTITGNVRNIGARCFYGCSAITNLDFTNNVINVGDYAFYNCKSLSVVKFGTAFATIPNTTTVFRSCSADLVIYGYENTYIKTFAESRGYKFRSLGEVTVGTVYIEGTAGDVTWSITNIGELRISGTGAVPDYTHYAYTPWNSYNSRITQLIVEETVTDIGNYAFSNLENLTKATLNNHGKIGSDAFSDCSALTELSGAEHITSIDKYAFLSCTKLNTIKISDSVTDIGISAFRGCSSISEISIPGSVTEIKSGVFARCTMLERVTIPESVTEIDSSAFEDTALSSVEGYEGSIAEAFAIQNSLKFESIGRMDDNVVLLEGKFYNLTYKLMSHGVLVINGSGKVEEKWYLWSKFIDTVIINDMNINYISSAFMEQTTNATTVAIPYSVVAISDNFLNTLPENITIAGFKGSVAEEAAKSKNIAFHAGAVMPDIVFASGETDGFTWSVTSYGVLTISGTGNLTNNVTKPIGIYRGIVREIILEEGIESIGSYCFDDSYFSRVNTVRTPSSVRSISTPAFPVGEDVTVYCYKYSAVYDYVEERMKYELVGTSPEWIIEEGEYSGFNWKITNYRHLTLKGEGIIPWGTAPWSRNISKIEKLTIDSSYIIVARDVFKLSLLRGGKLQTIYGYSNTTSQIMAEKAGVDFVSIGTVDEGAVILSGQLENTDINYELTNLGVLNITGAGDLPDYDYYTYDEINPWLKYDYLPIYEINISDSITKVGDFCFYMCDDTHTVNFGADIAAIGDCAFSYTNIKELKVPQSVKEIGASAFSFCKYLETVYIPDAVTAIPRGAFDGCGELTRIRLPKALTLINAYAFRNTNLSHVYYLGTTDEWNSRVSGKEQLPDTVTLYYSREIPENVTFEVTRVQKTEDGAEINIKATLQGGEHLIIAAYSEDGTLIGCRRVYKSGSYYTPFKGEVKTIKIFIWDDMTTLSPVPESRYYVRNF